MFSRTAVFAFATAPLLAAAMPGALQTRQSCSTGSIQCCQQTTSANSVSGSAILGLLGVILQDLDVLLGVNCSPLSVVGIGSGNACSATTVCCQDNSQGGLISIGCLPIIL
ncbi:fungal hydrophobin [Trametes meyenii]|nr:fungal hydrophobin [Trametes meyenii]